VPPHAGAAATSAGAQAPPPAPPTGAGSRGHRWQRASRGGLDQRTEPDHEASEVAQDTVTENPRQSRGRAGCTTKIK
jgi:hypothetical protein